MPTYDYECRDCGKRFEVFQSMNDPRLETCLADDCNGTMKRLIGTGAGIIFKGSGFYQTDYRSDSYRAGAKKDSDSSSSDSKKSSDKSSSSDSGGSSPKTGSSGTSSDNKSS